MYRHLLLASVLIAAPVSAQSISASDKAQGAQANPQLLAEFGGKYEGPQAAYVEQVGKRVALQSGLSNAQGDFTVALLNSPVENAFAIPGGYVYVTRQLLALMNSEAELASVMGHEVGHVAARHSAGRNRTATIGGVLASIVGAVAGNGTIGQLAGSAAQQAAGLYTLKYGRDQEYAADGLGVKYITAAGYSPYAAADMLTQLSAASTLQARVAGRDANAMPTWASSHPNSLDRIRRAERLAQQTGRPDTQGGQDTAFLRRLDGLRYDDDPRQGTVDGQTFRHPDLRVRFAAPAGYTIANGADAVTIAGSGGQAQFRTAPATGDLPAFIAARFRALGAAAGGEVRTGTVNGIPYAASTVGATASNRPVDATIVAYRFPSATHYFTVVTPRGSGLGALQPVIASVAPLSAQDAAAIRGKRIRIVTVKAGDTVDSLSRQMAYPTLQRDRFLTLNGLEPNEALRPGMLVKVVVAG
ncbi:peptidase M48 Ste24p [Sphingomonas sp. Leaf412]|uniref:M48 family metalloprotease n=1 Tax=Sphingomonas sp. Leaf412 TaxID=1736370 RepID=UPI0006FD3D98|nr:M48 family metalloprotease [Sphingomonas sp. Leaf412]KQT35106.1 peptidase M48 Ste24p [Sphingomonas sp. Leaf412]